MIRNIVVGQLRSADTADAGQLATGLDAIAALRFPGMLASHWGRDLGLAAPRWSFALTNDWADAESYRAYDADPEHNRLRAELIAPVCESIARVQFELPD